MALIFTISKCNFRALISCISIYYKEIFGKSKSDISGAKIIQMRAAFAEVIDYSMTFYNLNFSSAIFWNFYFYSSLPS